MRFKRVIILLFDSVGIGELPDAADFGDQGANTFKHVAEFSDDFKVPTLQSFGIGNIVPIKTVPPAQEPRAYYGKCIEKSKGKDTITGHWEIAGVVLEKPFSVWPNGFPDNIMKEFEEKTGFGYLVNRPYSGTQVISEYGEEHLKTGKLIVYTSADSVMQIAAHEDRIPLEKLYEVCTIARKILDPYMVGRVIARPFVGEAGNFTRTYNRRDYAMLPPYFNLVDQLQHAHIPTIGVGKIKNIYSNRGIDVSLHSEGNKDGFVKTIQAMSDYKKGLIFTNLVDFDMLWGHRNNPKGYAEALMEADSYLPEVIDKMDSDDLLIITADHGCDPTITSSTDHTREHIPLLVFHKKIKKGTNLGTRKSFADIGKTVAENFNVLLKNGTSFLDEII